ncbi:hypothetical protein GIB67_025182 [Kingdonia uniflora]|uniref:Uncharacterized protein n=1 Tax=Kingdonia uniflora TaxID=39325 RepID=A0A7J7N8W4_9MAGN|nr:hypothetical protein GIB67_025182 [Kingdonia uniflora]
MGMSKDVVPRPRFNNQVSQITQTPDGDVEVTFASTLIKLSLNMSQSTSEVIPHGVYTNPSTSTRPEVENERPTSSVSEASFYV